MITKQQWKEVEAELTEVISTVEFRLNNDRIIVSRQRMTEYLSELAVYFNGTIKPAWGLPDFGENKPEVHQFWRKSTRRYYSLAKQKEIKNDFGIRRAKEIFPDLEKTHDYYLPLFKKARTLCNQYKKIEGLELVRIGLHQQGTNNG